MAKKIGLFVVACLVSLLSFPQIGELKNNLSVGANAGALYNTVDFNPTVDQSGYFGYFFGGTLRYISEKYMGLFCGLQFEMNFVDKGWNEEAEKGGFKRSMSYLEVPFLAHMAYGNKSVRGFLNLGPQFSFLLDERNIVTVNNSDAYNHSHWADNRFDYGIMGGLGMEVRSKAGNFLLEARYYFGLSDIYRNGKTDYYGRSAHSTISLKLSYLFDIIKD